MFKEESKVNRSHNNVVALQADLDGPTVTPRAFSWLQLQLINITPSERLICPHHPGCGRDLDTA
jgi:hypothetical protein